MSLRGLINNLIGRTHKSSHQKNTDGIQKKAVPKFISSEKDEEYSLRIQDYGEKFERNFPKIRSILIRSTAIFMLITFSVYAALNYKVIIAQMRDYKNGGPNPDVDADGIPDEWENEFGLNPKDPFDAGQDYDDDTLTNLKEYTFGTDPRKKDTDDDGVRDDEEITLGENPLGEGKLDLDADGMPDFWERSYGFNISDQNDAKIDTDGDGLTNFEEYQYLTNPLARDSDQDSVDDKEEIDAGDDPNGFGKLDTDNDGIPDVYEDENDFDKNNSGDSIQDTDEDRLLNIDEFRIGTDPNNPDTDGDSYLDGEEMKNGYDPLGEGKLDQDEDSIPGWWERRFGLSDENPSDAEEDFDDDGLSNALEFFYGSDPTASDTDKDGYPDGLEVANNFSPIGAGRIDGDFDGLIDSEEENYGTDTERADTDSDLLKDGSEVYDYKTKPLDEDTDDDTYLDGVEVANGYDPLGSGIIQKLDLDKDGLSGEYEEIFNLNPRESDTDHDSINDLDELYEGTDPSGQGDLDVHVFVHQAGVSDVPLVFCKSTEEEGLQSCLERGIVHYPGTAPPGLPGNSYITGHSSDYAWKAGSFKTILSQLNDLPIGGEFVIEYKLKNGRVANFVYTVKTKEVVLADDKRLFQTEKKQIITLVTCWPITTAWKRLMVKAELTGVSIRDDSQQ